MPTGEDTEEVDLHDYIPGKESSSSPSGEAYSEDEDECYFGDHSGLGGRVQCAHQ